MGNWILCRFCVHDIESTGGKNVLERQVIESHQNLKLL